MRRGSPAASGAPSASATLPTITREAAGVEPDVRVAAGEERHAFEDVDGVLAAGDGILE